MPVSYSLEKVFLLAERMETSGGAFYRQAAEAAANEDSRQFFLMLAQQEDGHRRTFARLRAQAADVPGDDVAQGTDDEAVKRYLQAVAGEFMFDEALSAEDILAGDETIEDILWMAVKREKDSIVLYLGIIDAMGKEGDKRLVQKILSEEQSHLAELMYQLESVPADETD
jgi:rubrerythrin